MKAVRSQFTPRVHVPSIRQPTINRNFTFPLQVMAQQVMNDPANGVSTVLYRVENVVSLVQETVGLPSSFYGNIRIRPNHIKCYGQFEKDGSTDPLFTMVVFNPLVGSTEKTVAVQGTQVYPARTAVDYAEQTAHYPYTWDGTEGTSAPLIGIKSTQNILVSVYFQITCIIQKEIITADDFQLANVRA